MALTKGIDKDNVIHWPNGVLLSYLKNEIMKFTGKQLELKKKNQSEWGEPDIKWQILYVFCDV